MNAKNKLIKGTLSAVVALGLAVGISGSGFAKATYKTKVTPDEFSQCRQQSGWTFKDCCSYYGGTYSNAGGESCDFGDWSVGHSGTGGSGSGGSTGGSSNDPCKGSPSKRNPYWPNGGTPSKNVCV